MTKDIIINTICEKYYDLNKRDFRAGRIDSDVRAAADNSVIGFKKALEKLSDSEIAEFYTLSPSLMDIAFSIDAALDYAQTFPRPMMESVYKVSSYRLVDTGLIHKASVLMALAPRMEWLEKLLNADYTDLGNGVVAYTNINNKE